MSDTAGLVVLGWAIGIVGGAYGLFAAITGRGRFWPRGTPEQSTRVRVAGLMCALTASLLAWVILTHPVVTGRD
jgi:hypothetical protein